MLVCKLSPIWLQNSFLLYVLSSFPSWGGRCVLWIKEFIKRSNKMLKKAISKYSLSPEDVHLNWQGFTEHIQHRTLLLRLSNLQRIISRSSLDGRTHQNDEFSWPWVYEACKMFVILPAYHLFSSTPLPISIFFILHSVNLSILASTCLVLKLILGSLKNIYFQLKMHQG